MENLDRTGCENRTFPLNSQSGHQEPDRCQHELVILVILWQNGIYLQSMFFSLIFICKKREKKDYVWIMDYACIIFPFSGVGL